MAEMLANRCAQSIHSTTVAKIEAGKRSVRINEAVAIADLFDLSVDALLGRQEPDDTTLTFAMTTLIDYVRDAEGRIVEAQHTAADINDQIHNVEECFNPTHIKVLQRTAHDMANHLAKAKALATKLIQTTSMVIVHAGKET